MKGIDSSMYSWQWAADVSPDEFASHFFENAIGLMGQLTKECGEDKNSDPKLLKRVLKQVGKLQVTSDNSKEVWRFLDRVRNLNGKDPKYLKPLLGLYLRAIHQNDQKLIESVSWLIQSKPSSQPSSQTQQERLLMVYAEAEILAGVKDLLEKKVSANTSGPLGLRPAHIACIKGNLPLLQILAQYGADLRATNDYGFNCMDIAILQKHKDISDDLLGRKIFPGIVMELILACAKDDCAEVSNLLCDLNITKLHLEVRKLLLDKAFEMGYTNMFKELYYPSCNANDYLLNAIMKSDEDKYEEIILFLKQKGADINFVKGNRPMLLNFCLMGDLRFVRRALKYGADINALDNIGKSALVLAVQGGS
jgi:hypothetical protein